MHPLELYSIVAIENVNHPNDFHIIFDGGQITFNPSYGPLRFSYNGESVVLANREDVTAFKEKLWAEKIATLCECSE